MVYPMRWTTLLLMSRSYKAWKVLYWVVGGWVAGIYKTITNSASAEAGVEARLSLATNLLQHVDNDEFCFVVSN